MITTKNTDLFRYDLQVPPKGWKSDFLNDEYLFEGIGHKNKAKLYFFTDSIQIAHSLGIEACRKNGKEYYYLTSLNTVNELQLIDFSKCATIYQMMDILHELNIDIFTDQLKTFENDNNFLQLRPIFDSILEEPDLRRKVDLISKLTIDTRTDCYNTGLFGQRLTDFANGIIFKEMVKRTCPHADGYIWKEFNDPRGLSCCLFDSEKLSEKLNISLNYI
ncbi:hypothetical protein [Flavobacterium soyae]|uniref:RES domain-containing protein n=1 Tax=Flavobacterium soyae TaxID=2903098 RepID=A0ABZ2UAT8_9FLAO